MLTHDACDIYQQSFEGLGWLKSSKSLQFSRALNNFYPDAQACWLKEFLHTEVLTARASAYLEDAIASGLTLRRNFGSCTRPRDWLGERFYFGRASHIDGTANFASLVSSQLGRGSRNLPEWPRLINWCLKQVYRDRDNLLVCPGTTLYESSRHHAAVAEIPLCTVDLPDERSNLLSWLQSLWTILANPSARQNDILSIGPTVDDNSLPENVSSGFHSNPKISKYPLRDRVLFALADRAYCIHARDKGTVSALLEMRLQDERFAEGSLFVSLNGIQKLKTDWLTKGAVGIYTPTSYQASTGASICSLRHRSHSLTASLHDMPRLGVDFAKSSWSYLTHCTRGGQDHLPEESQEQFQLRTWIQEEALASSAFDTLSRILICKKLLGTSRITRTANRCVSFSEVPVLELLKRRTFRRHLGRWDWEPYGILIKQSAAKKLGAQPVIYGDEECFNSLPDEQRPFFQPGNSSISKPMQSETTDWSQEMEWRTLGDFDFSRLDSNELLVFTQFRSEAQQLSRISNWPVLWLYEKTAPQGKK